RIGVWRAAWGEDAGRPSGHLAPAVAAGSVTSVLACAHAAVQTFGAAGTSDPAIVGLYRAAYGIPEICGSAQSLWRQAGSRRPWGPDPMLVADHRKPGGKRGEPAVG
ncbi:MAG: hypothetical protein QOE61_3863, partial [Micromonosporaceae bacterium]|nr:hypothetical protein [Micromonosporaceae bacterium]